MAPSPAQIDRLLESLATHEYWVRKYRARAESRDSDGNRRSASEYHTMAVEEREKAGKVSQELERLLGPDGGSPWGGVEYLKLAWRHGEMLRKLGADEGSFEEACFARRHPRWGQASERYQNALARWQGTPELDAMAPQYLPIYEGWVD